MLADIGGPARLVKMADRFYARVFVDSHVDQFVTNHHEPHGIRLGMWIAEKMGGEAVWSSHRHPDARSMSHRKAWECPKRKSSHIGRRFKLDDCRVWMRLIFWAAREEGLDQNKEFFRFFVTFIQSFIGVYERSAPPFTKESAEWSATPSNIQTYLDNGRKMSDVIGRVARH